MILNNKCKTDKYRGVLFVFHKYKYIYLISMTSSKTIHLTNEYQIDLVITTVWYEFSSIIFDTKQQGIYICIYHKENAFGFDILYHHFIIYYYESYIIGTSDISLVDKQSSLAKRSTEQNKKKTKVNLLQVSSFQTYTNHIHKNKKRKKPFPFKVCSEAPLWKVFSTTYKLIHIWCTYYS